MIRILPVTEDPDLGRWLRAAAPDRDAGGEQLQWLDKPPESRADVLDLLLVDRRGSKPAEGYVEGLRHRPRFIVLIVPDSAWDDQTLGEELASADDVLTWPAAESRLAVAWSHWLVRVRSVRHTEQVESRLSKLSRENNELKRNVARLGQHARVRDRDAGDLRQILARMEGITRLSHRINSLELDEIVDLCIRRIPSLLGAKLASLYFYDENRRTLKLKKHNHPYAINAIVNVDERPNSPMAMAVSRRQVMLINDPDWQQKVDAAITRPYAHRYSTGNCVIAPMISGGRVIGVLNLADKADNEIFDELSDLVPIRQMAELLAASIRNIELYQTVQEQARTDGMTGLANHSTFVHELGREITRARRYSSPLSLILIDVDSLKGINDTLGHVAGDRALKLVSRQIVNTIRESDLAARYGGDEFAIMLPSTPLAAARAVAQRLVETMASVPLVTDDNSVAVTVSIGLGEYDGENRAPEAFIEQIDAVLYDAKKEGKNRIAVRR